MRKHTQDHRSRQGSSCGRDWSCQWQRLVLACGQGFSRPLVENGFRSDMDYVNFRSCSLSLLVIQTPLSSFLLLSFPFLSRPHPLSLSSSPVAGFEHPLIFFLLLAPRLRLSFFLLWTNFLQKSIILHFYSKNLITYHGPKRTQLDYVIVNC